MIVHGRTENKVRAIAATELYAMLSELRKPVPDELGPAVLTQMIASAAEAGERVDATAKWEAIEEADRQIIVRAAHAACAIVERVYRRRQRDADEPEGEVSRG